MTKREAVKILEVTQDKTPHRPATREEEIDALAAAGIQFDPEPVEKTPGHEIADLFFFREREVALHAQLRDKIDAALLADRQGRKPSQSAVEMAEQFVRLNVSGDCLVFGEKRWLCEPRYGYAKVIMENVRTEAAKAFELAKGGEARVDWEKYRIELLERINSVGIGPKEHWYRDHIHRTINAFFRSKAASAKA